MEYLREEVVENPTYFTEKVKCHLREHFDKHVVFYQADKVGKRRIVYCANIPLHIQNGRVPQQSGRVNIILRERFPISGISLHSRYIRAAFSLNGFRFYLAALLIWSDIKSVKDSMSWPASPQDIDDVKAKVPASPYNLLAWILVEDSTPAIPTKGSLLKWPTTIFILESCQSGRTSCTALLRVK